MNIHHPIKWPECLITFVVDPCLGSEVHRFVPNCISAYLGGPITLQGLVTSCSCKGALLSDVQLSSIHFNSCDRSSPQYQFKVTDTEIVVYQLDIETTVQVFNNSKFWIGQASYIMTIDFPKSNEQLHLLNFDNCLVAYPNHKLLFTNKGFSTPVLPKIEKMRWRDL